MRSFALLVLLAGCRPATSSLSATEVYERLSPSIAHLSMGLSGGSGVLLDGRMVLTNAHVVWPHEKTRVTFAPDLEFIDVPVKAIDIDADLALVGPLPDSLDRKPLTIVSPEGLPIGSEVFLIGYPGEIEKFPQPAITRGVLSRVREARFENLTFLQSDATIVGGQSGGALVSSKGDIIGISGLIGIEQFALVLSGADVLARMPGISESPSPLARSTTAPKVDTTQPFSFDATHRQAAWLFQANEGDQVRLTLDGAAIAVFDSDLSAVEEPLGDSFRFDVSGPQFVVATQAEARSGTLESDHFLTAFSDPDDGQAIRIGTDLHGVIDFPTDEDRYVLPLEAGQQVSVRVDGVLDALCSVFDESGEEELAAARVAEGGLGMAAELRFEAPRTGRFVVAVGESSPEGPAGYELRVSLADRGTRPRRAAPTDAGVLRNRR